MCKPPFRQESWEAVAEKPIGLAMSYLGGTWLAEDTPMLLHTFEYLARKALLSWWDTLSSQPPSEGIQADVQENARR